MSPWPRIGLSTYMVWRLGASKPVSHMSRTSTTPSASPGSRKRLASASRRGLLRMCSCQSGGIGGGAGHHDLHDTRVVAVGAPVGAQPRELAVELDADAAAHADDHGLAVEGFETLLEVGDDVLGDQLQPFLRADDRLQLRPLSLEFLLALDLLALGGLLELRVDLGLLTLVEGQFGEAALVVDRDRRVGPRPSAGCRRC